MLSLAPDAQLCERDVARERELVLGVAYALLRFTPSVVDASEAVVLLDVTASLRLFHGIRALRQRVRDVAVSFGVTAVVSVASSGAAAWMIVRSLRRRRAVRALARVSLAVAPPARPYVQWFDELGCTMLADLQRLPRAGLKKRRGTPLLDWLDQVVGTAPAAYDWLDMPPAFDTRVELMNRVEHAEALLFVARRLILQMTGWPAAKQLDVAAFVLQLEHERGRDAIAPTGIEIALGAPTRFDEHLTRLVKERIAHVELAAPVIAVRLVANRMQPAAPSESLFPEPGGTPQDHARLLELLTARLGAENVLAPAPIADYRPEAAARWVPLRIVSPGGRIEGGWQDGRIVTRDYFVAEDENGACYWVFKERPSASDETEPRYFLHGLFG